MTARVVVAERAPLVRLAIRSALEAGGITVAAEAAGAEEALAAAAEHRPGAVLVERDLDPSMDLVARLHAELPGAALVVLALDDDAALAAAAVRAGACGYLPADMPPDRLAAAVRGTLRGEAAIPRALVRRLLEDGVRRDGLGPGAQPAGLRAPLTGRELEVIGLLAEGHSDRSVGSRLGLSEVTVRRHAAAASRKLRARRREDAVETFRRLVA